MTQASVIEYPPVLFVPGRGGFADWQLTAADWRPDSLCVDMRGMPDDRQRNPWLGRLDRAVAAASGPVVIAAHGLGALAVAWWGGLLGRRAAPLVAGALLVAPARPEMDPSLADFAPLPTSMLPFPSIVARGDGDAEHALLCAAEWVSDTSEAGLDRVGSLIDLLVVGGSGLSHYTYRPEPPLRPAGRPVRPPPRPVDHRL